MCQGRRIHRSLDFSANRVKMNSLLECNKMAGATVPSTSIPAKPTRQPAPIPKLKNGAGLPRAESEARYAAMPGIRADLIEGVLHMASPVSQTSPAGPHADLMGWLVAYRAYTTEVHVGDNATVRLDLDNEPQPDGFLMIA